MERFFNTYKFSNHGNNKFIYCYEKVFILINIRMIGENSMKHFDSHINVEDITNADFERN